MGKINKNSDSAPNMKSNPNFVHKVHGNQKCPNQGNQRRGDRKDLSAMKNNKNFKNKFRENASGFNPKHNIKPKGGLALALEEYKLKKEEEKRRKEENKVRKEEMNKALQRYKEKKAQKLKRLCKKTKKGQPIMKYWIEDLLQKIQSSS